MASCTLIRYSTPALRRSMGLVPRYSSTWTETQVAESDTHHVWRQGLTHNSNQPLEACYQQRFAWVLPFHSPGLAPVGTLDGVAFHIDILGEAAYSRRFDRTFGFYEGLAAVNKEGNAFHIRPDGSTQTVDSNLFRWVGNYQRGFAAAQQHDGLYVHLTADGKPMRPDPYLYAGDFREGSAAVRKMDGLCTHVSNQGTLVEYDQNLFELGPFHKGIAVAKDMHGWFHIRKGGSEVLPNQRFRHLEDFYNGRAYAVTMDGHHVIIGDDGSTTTRMTSSDAELQAQVHDICVSPWKAFALLYGVKLGLHEHSPDDVSKHTDFQCAVWSAWQDLGLVEGTSLSEKGLQMFRSDSVTRNVQYWLDLQLEPWVRAWEALRKGQEPSVTSNFFKRSDPHSNSLIVQVLDGYSKQDFEELPAAIAPLIPQDSSVVDLGGGAGHVLRLLASTRPDISSTLADLPMVVEQAGEEATPFQCIGLDMFTEPLPESDVYIMTRVLHDWPDSSVVDLLKRIRGVTSKLLLVDRCKSDGSPSLGLLSLNMHLIGGGKERTMPQFMDLLDWAGWTVSETKRLNGSHFLFVCQALR